MTRGWNGVARTLVGLLLIAGCQNQPTTTPSTPDTPTARPAPSSSVRWIEPPFAHAGLTIELGYRGEGVRAAQGLEPVVRLTRDGKSVADAMVFHQLIAMDDRPARGEEVATVYEGDGGSDQGVYAQGRHPISGDPRSCVVRFRVVLAGVDEDWMHELTLAAP